MKNGLLILSGGGDPFISFNLDKEYFSLLKDNSKILYIPVALSRSKSFSGYQSCFEWFSELISKHSNGKKITFEMFTEEDDFPDLELFDSIYIGGGSTYYLIDFVYKKGLGDKIVNYIKTGGIVYGGSAGAMIFGKDIGTVKEENDDNYINHRGLNIIQGKSVFCHFSESSDQKIFNIAKELNSDVIVLPEESGLIIDGDENFIKNVNKVYIFTKSSKHQL